MIRRIAIFLSVSTPLACVLLLKTVFATGPGTFNHTVYATYASNTLLNPTGLYIAPSDPNDLYFVDEGHNKVMSLSGGLLGTIAGSGSAGMADGSLTTATFNHPMGLSGYGRRTYSDSNGPESSILDLTVYDASNNLLRRICIVAVLGPHPVNPTGCFTPSGVKTVAGSGTAGFANGSGASALLYAPSSGSYSTTTTNYFTDVQNNLVRSYTYTNGSVTSASSNPSPGYVNGPLSSAQFNAPTSVVADSSGNSYVTDSANYVIRKINSSGGVTTYAGSGTQGYANGASSSAAFASPVSVAFNAADGSLFIADALNNCIRRVDSAGNVTTYAGSQSPGLVNGSLSQARFSNPTSVALSQGILYVADTGNNAIRAITLSSGTVSTLVH